MWILILINTLTTILVSYYMETANQRNVIVITSNNILVVMAIITLWYFT